MMDKLGLFPYDKKFTQMFRRERKKILEVLKDCEIHHVGSTAVPGLGGKGMIDILVVLDDWKKEENFIKKLKSLGFTHIHPKEKGRIFLSKIGPTQFENTHLHLVKKGNRAYQDFLTFRDYLKNDRKAAQEYFELKLKWKKEGKGSRKKYRKMKEGYLKAKSISI